MKNSLSNKKSYSLGDLILAVSSCSRNSRETAAAVADLFDSGRVRIGSKGQPVRARIC